MEVGAVKRQIKNNALDKFYIFTGEELEVQRIYVNKISEVANKTIQRIEKVTDAFTKTQSLFSKAKCYVCRDDDTVVKSEKLWDSIEELLGDNMLILLITNVDKRTKFYKHFSDKIVEFTYMTDDLLYKYIRKEIPLSQTNCATLIDICGRDYSRILLECDKIKTYYETAYNDTYAKPPIDKAFLQLLTDGTIYIPPDDAIFKYVDAVLKNKPMLAFKLLEQCKRIGEPALRLIMVLYNNTKQVLQVQSCKSKDIPKATGLSAWEVKCAMDKSDYWSDGDLVYFLRLLNYTENAIKLGEIEESVAMDYIMTNIF